MDICVLRNRGLELSELCMVIMKDMKQHISRHLRDTISVAMVAAGIKMDTISSLEELLMSSMSVGIGLAQLKWNQL